MNPEFYQPLMEILWYFVPHPLKDEFHRLVTALEAAESDAATFQAIAEAEGYTLHFRDPEDPESGYWAKDEEADDARVPV